MKPQFTGNPDPMFVLLKDHMTVNEAAGINAQVLSGVFERIIYSLEWFWSKVLHIMREGEEIRKTVVSWMEHCDWIPAVLACANEIGKNKRYRCSAGHRAMWSESFEDKLPSEGFLIALDPLLKGLREDEQKEALLAELSKKMIPHIEDVCASLPIEDSVNIQDLIFCRRTPDAIQLLTRTLSRLKMGTDAYRIYKSLVDATAFGARAIQDRFLQQGVPINRVIGIGGVARKSSLVMPTLADVLNREILILASDQACALGSCISAAVSAGIYTSVEDAQKAMGNGFDASYKPVSENVEAYEKLYRKYKQLGKFVEDQTGVME